MRLAIALVCALSGAARAGAVADPPPLPLPEHDFWRDVLEPHAVEITEVLRLVHDGEVQIASYAERGRADATSHQRMLVEMRGMLRYAFVLAPEDPRVLDLGAEVLHALGLTDDARDLYRAALRARPEPANMEARLGLLDLRRGDRDALPHLVAATGPEALTSVDNASALLAVANLAARGGDVAAAADLLGATNDRGDRAASVLAAFALAVLYDRDEQLGKRDDLIHDLRVRYEGDYGDRVAQAIALGRLPDPEDHFYYQALLYESAGALLEARAEWAHYAAVPDAPWRDRPSAHIRAIDRMAVERRR